MGMDEISGDHMKRRSVHCSLNIWGSPQGRITQRPARKTEQWVLRVNPERTLV